MPTIGPFSKPEELGPERVGQIRDHLKEVVSSPTFAASKRAQDFLQLIVDHALAGRFDLLRERMIGAEMFGRPIDYDTANDAVVRVKATEVRKKLAQYYQEAANPPSVRIELPTGSYAPRFYCELPEISPGPVAALDVSASIQEKEDRLGDVQPKTLHSIPRIWVVSLAVLAFTATIGYAGCRFWSREGPAKTKVRSIAVQEHVRKEGLGRYEVALIYSALGERDEAFAWLEKSFAAHDKGLTYLRIDPCLDPLRSDQRFQDLVRRVGFP